MRRLAIIASLPLLGLPCAAWAQVPDTTVRMVPAEMVELLWGPGPFGARTDLLVGQLHEGLTATLDVGPEARVIGSTQSRMLTLGAVVMPGGRQAVRDAWDAKLRAGGWPAYEQQAEAQGGFASDRAPDEATQAYCSPDDRMLTVMTRGHRGDSTAVILVLSGDAGRSPCAPDLPSSAMRRMDSPVPTLRAPDGARQGRSGSGGGGGEWESHARLRTDLTPGALLGHYATQLLEQGWQPIAQSVAEDVAIHVSRKTDDEGVAWQAVLSVSLLPGGGRDLYLRVTRSGR